jgi:hypothetical protein
VGDGTEHAFNRRAVSHVELDGAGAVGEETIGADHIPAELLEVIAHRCADSSEGAGYNRGAHAVIVGVCRAGDGTHINLLKTQRDRYDRCT